MYICLDQQKVDKNHRKNLSYKSYDVEYMTSRSLLGITIVKPTKIEVIAVYYEEKRSH